MSRKAACFCLLEGVLEEEATRLLAGAASQSLNPLMLSLAVVKCWRVNVEVMFISLAEEGADGRPFMA